MEITQGRKKVKELENQLNESKSKNFKMAWSHMGNWERFIFILGYVVLCVGVFLLAYYIGGLLGGILFGS